MPDKRNASCLQGGTARAPSESLQKLRRGEMSLDEYLDEAAEAAIGRFKGILSNQDVEVMRATLREHLRTDPITTEMVRRVTGQTPNSEPPASKN